MARKKSAAGTPEQDLLAEIKQRYSLAEGADSENRRQMAEDLRFCYVLGEQWDGPTLTRRKGRPCYSYNRVVGVVNQIIGDQRQVKPACKVRATNKQASAKKAEVLSGLCRNIEACSDAESTYDMQFKYAVAGGWGAWRVLPEYVSEDSFDQELRIKNIPNPFTVYFDPAATDPTGRDANWAIVAERIDRDVFREMYPGVEPISVDVSRDQRGWATDKQIRVAEYFKKTFKRKKIALLSNGKVIDYNADARKNEQLLAAMAQELGDAIPTIQSVRETKDWTVTWWKTDGAQILEGPIEYKWKYIPVVRLPGRFLNIEGKLQFQSVIRHAKDSQRSYNYHRSTMVELAALTPRAPYIVTAKMVKGYEDQWNQANAVNRPYLMYDVDKDSPTVKPERAPPPDVPQAMISLAAQDAEDIKATTGYYDPSLGIQDGQPRSGKAIIAEQRKGDLGSYEFLDNFAKAKQFTWEIMIDMIPQVYDTERVVRIIGDDSAEDYIKLGPEPSPQMGQADMAAPPMQTKQQEQYDLSEGSYDVSVTIGPSYATQRLETVSVLLDAMERVPDMAAVGPDLFVKNLDISDAQEWEKRLRKRLIAQGVIEPNEREQQEMGPPPPPDPMQVALVERLQAQAAKDVASAQLDAGDAAMKPLEMEKLVAEIVQKRLESLQLAGEMAVGGEAVVAAQRRAATDGRVQT
jgi:hypothetical protein